MEMGGGIFVSYLSYKRRDITNKGSAVREAFG